MEQKVLICAVTSDRHAHIIDRWIESVKSQDYPADVFVIDNSEQRGEHFEKLANAGFKVIHVDWDKKREHPLQMLAHQREMYRWRAVAEGYDYLFHWDTDIILPTTGLSRLVAHDKDNVGYLVHVYYEPNTLPCVFHSGKLLFKTDSIMLDYFTWEEITALNGQLTQVYATGLGILLSKRKVFENVPFVTHSTFIYGEDLWFHNLANEKGYEFWIDPIRMEHQNKRWEGVMSANESGKKLNFFIGCGPVDGEQVVIDRSLPREDPKEQASTDNK